MPISFKCDGCRKDYLVSDGLAGKRAACKACGHRMVIPGAPNVPVAAPVARSAAPRPATAAPQPARPAKVVPVAIPVARVKAVPKSEPPAADLYGLDEAPSALPPMMPRLGASGSAAEGEAPVKKKKKKKKGFFVFGGARPSASKSGGRGEGISGFRLIGIIFAVASGIGGGIAGFGLASKPEIERFHQGMIDLDARFIAELSTVRDVPSAHAASGKILQTLDLMTQHIEKHRHKKGNKATILEVNRRYEAQHKAHEQQAFNEMRRITAIPGALQALHIEGPLQRLAILVQEAANEGPAELR